jgi:hypothetical protein
MVSKISIAFIFLGIFLLGSWCLLSAPFLGSYAHINPGPEPSGGYGSGFYLLEYPAILLLPLIFGVAFLTYGISPSLKER